MGEGKGTVAHFSLGQSHFHIVEIGLAQRQDTKTLSLTWV
jgi:hypothetical protein